MKPGPAPTPTKILKNRDSWRAKIRPGEPQPTLGAPKKPRWLNARPAQEWRRMVKLLDAMGILAHTDANALARYCQLWHRWLEAEEFIALHGSTYPVYSPTLKTEDGKPLAIGFRTFPQVKIASSLATQLARLENEFGLTPAARTRVVAQESTKQESSNRGAPGRPKFDQFSA